jgi:hypothetical protein
MDTVTSIAAIYDRIPLYLTRAQSDF